MTTPDERARAVFRTRYFLENLARPSACVPASVRLQAEALLRHFPDEADIELTCRAFPTWWQMPASRGIR
jgi:hypothetical protein